jgi:hypothetical protein
MGSTRRVIFQKNDATERELSDWLMQIPANGGLHAVIESVHASPQMGVTSAFTFGRGYGFLRGLLIGAKIPFEEVSPVRWQAALGCRSKGDKNVTKAKAGQLFPDVKVTHANADALLLAEYLRRLKNGEFAK